MTYMDHVEVIVEKEKYARDGVYKGMQGWVTEPENINGYWLVNFPQCGENDDIATIPVKEEDLKVVRILDARVNERIKAEHEETAPNEKGSKNTLDDSGDLSGYMV